MPFEAERMVDSLECPGKLRVCYNTTLVVDLRFDVSVSDVDGVPRACGTQAHREGRVANPNAGQRFNL